MSLTRPPESRKVLLKLLQLDKIELEIKRLEKRQKEKFASKLLMRRNSLL
jgi:hypothetical protein